MLAPTDMIKLTGEGKMSQVLLDGHAVAVVDVGNGAGVQRLSLPLVPKCCSGV